MWKEPYTQEPERYSDQTKRHCGQGRVSSLDLDSEKSKRPEQNSSEFCKGGLKQDFGNKFSDSSQNRHE
jgi:hypothetical protein